MSRVFLVAFLFVVASCDEVNEVKTHSKDEVKPKVLVSTGDSYLTAYKISQNSAVQKQATRKDYTPHQGYPDALYNLPVDNYGAPMPKPIYGPPIYGPPAQSYGPPPQPLEPAPFIPYALLGGLLDKFKFKIDLFTLGKILLKVVIFKKIVSFIAIICLLLFIPTLKHKDDDHMDDDIMRSMQYKTTADRKMDELTAFILEAIENYDKVQNESERAVCDTLYCKVTNAIDRINKKLTYNRLFKLYAKEVKK